MTLLIDRYFTLTYKYIIKVYVKKLSDPLINIKRQNVRPIRII